MKDSKKIIIITLIVATFLACIAGFTVYRITLNNSGIKNKQNYLKIGNYSLQYGTYKGYNIEYEWDDQNGKMKEISKNELILKLNSDNTYELSGEKHKFSVAGLYIIVPDFNNSTMFKVIGNNKIEFQIGSGIEMTYSNK